MLERQSERIELAKKVLVEIKQEVTSLNDIIPHSELPFLHPENTNSYIDRFGLQRFTDYFNHNKFLGEIRHQTTKFMETRYDFDRFSTHMKAHIAISMLGVGECSETSIFATVKLLSLNFELPVNYVYLQGNLVNNLTSTYDHAVVIIGNVAGKATQGTLDWLRNLDDDAILLDPSLGIIGKANQTQVLLKDFIELYSICTSPQIEQITPGSKERLESLIEDSKSISESVKKQFILAELERITGNNHWKYDSNKKLAHLALDNPVDVLKIKQLLEKNGLITQENKIKGLGKPIIIVKEPNLKKLRAIDCSNIVEEMTKLGKIRKEETTLELAEKIAQLANR